MQKYMEGLGYDLKGFTISALQAMFSHVYYTWKILKSELGQDQALKTYGKVWRAVCLATFRTATESLGIKEIKDIPTLGRIVNFIFSGNPCLYETAEDTPNHHIGRILWCANPAYGPPDCTLSRHEFWRNAEIPVTVTPFLTTLVTLAKEMGLKEDVEVAVPAGRCRDGNASFCQIHLWRKGSPSVEPECLPDSEKRFIEDEMGDEEPIIFILRKQGKKLEDFAPGTLVNYVFVDMAAWDALEEDLGNKRGLDLYKKVWLTYPPMWVKDARLELEIGKATNLGELARIIAFCEKKRFVPYQIASGGDGQVTLISKDDPFAEIPMAFLGRKLGANYFKAVALADQEFVDQVVVEAKMASEARVTVKKRLVQGDDRNELVIVRK